MGYKAGVIVESKIPFASQPIKNGQQAAMLLVDARPNKVNDRNVVPWLAFSPKAMAEHETERCLQHGLVGLLQACFVVKSQDLTGRGGLLIGAGEKTIDLRPIDGVRFELAHAALLAKRVYCARYLQERHLFATAEPQIPALPAPCN